MANKTLRKLKICILVSALLVILGFTLPVNAQTADSTPPQVLVNFPSPGMVVYGVTGISAVASDNTSVSRIEFYVDGVFMAVRTISPYHFGWDTTNGNTHPCNGPHTHTLSAKAYDPYGNVGTSPDVIVNMNNPSYCPVITPLPTSTPIVTPTPLPTPAPTPIPTPTPSQSPFPTPSLTPAPPSTDNVTPLVNVNFPPPGMVVYGMTGISVVASDNVGVGRVEFYVDGILRAVRTIAPYYFGWDTNENGTHSCNGPHTHTLSAKAYDGAGNVGASSPVVVNMNNPSYCPVITPLPTSTPIVTPTPIPTPVPTPIPTPTPSQSPFPTPSFTPAPPPNDNISPLVNLNFPPPGMTVYGVTGMSAVASDNVGVSRIEFYIDGILRAVRTISPYYFGWDTTENNTHSCDNSHTHTLSAKAYDAAGNSGTSPNVIVNMNNPAYCPVNTPLPTLVPTPTPTDTISPTPSPSTSPTPTPTSYSVIASPETIITGEDINVSWTTPDFVNTLFDWIGLYKVGDTDTQFIEWKYTQLRGGDTTFTIWTPGIYEIRYFKNNGYTKVATSNTFVVVLPVVDPNLVTNYPSQGVNLIALGDSITAGVGAPPGENYVDELSRRIDQTIMNAGKSGSTTRDALARLDTDVLSKDPKVVIVLIGGSDILKQIRDRIRTTNPILAGIIDEIIIKNGGDPNAPGVPETETFENIRSIVDQIHGSGSMAIVLSYKGGIFGDTYESKYKQIAVDTGAAFIPNILDGIIGNPFYMSDLIHPNELGYRIMAMRIEPVIKALLN